jgi:uncharacterized protein YgiM (DUF1202 family)
MDNAPGVRFVSLTFLVGFGVGAFIGVALALMAVAIAKDPTSETQYIEVPVLPSPTPMVGDTPAPSVRATAALAVRVGPGESYATLGTIARGDDLSVVGRDFDSEWLAIEFPEGSTARGWIPAANVEGLSVSNVSALAVLLPTPLPIELSTPQAFFGTPGTPETGTPEGDEGTPNPFAETSDVAVFKVSALSDGRVRVVVLNGGPADLIEAILVVTVRNLNTSFENFFYTGDLPAGATITFTTSSFALGETPEPVQIVVDPSSSLNDPNRLNNVLTEELSRPKPVATTPATAGPD